MSHWRSLVALLSIVLVPLAAGAAPAGKVVIAQGVDPTSLDMMNQQEQPASNVGAQMFESLIERDQGLNDLCGANKRLAWKARSDELIRAYDMSLKDGK